MCGGLIVHCGPMNTPLYGISAILSSAADECSTGMLVRLSTLLSTTASRSVQSPSFETSPFEGTQTDWAAHLADRQQDTLEERGWLENGLFERHKQMKVEPMVLGQVVTQPRQQHKIVKPEARVRLITRARSAEARQTQYTYVSKIAIPLGQLGVEVRRKEPCRLEHGGSGPLVRTRQL